MAGCLKLNLGLMILAKFDSSLVKPILVIAMLGLVYWFIFNRPKIRPRRGASSSAKGVGRIARQVFGAASLFIVAGTTRIEHYLMILIIGVAVIVALLILLWWWRSQRSKRRSN